MRPKGSNTQSGWLETLSGGAPEETAGFGLVLAWYREEPQRVGELALAPVEGLGVLGRDGLGAEEGESPLNFARHRPGRIEGTPPLRSPRLSRRQLEVRATATGVYVRNVGAARMAVNGEIVEEAELLPGDVLEVWRELVLLCELWPGPLPMVRGPLHPFGFPDRHGLVGESPAAWTVRRELGLAANLPGHVLITGPSGSGKELAANMVHHLSPQARGPFVSRNASTFPRELLDAELFGNRAGYPNPGMPERPGVVGEADGGTLFLDEIGEIGHEAQAHLLRVLDAGEYHRLGESRARAARLRLVAATNRPEDALKHDFAARFSHRVQLGGLGGRRMDIPLLLAHQLRSAQEEAPALFADAAPPLPHPRLVTALLRRGWTTHARELRSLVWDALRAWALAGGGPYLDLPAPPAPGSAPPGPPAGSAAAGSAAAGSAAPEPIAARRRRAGPDPTREEVLAAYRAAGGVQARVPTLLGLADRFQLKRLELKLGITPADRERALDGG